MNADSVIRPHGNLSIQVNRTRAPFGWRLRNYLRPAFILTWIGVKLIVPLAKVFGIATMYGELRGVKLVFPDPVEGGLYLKLRLAKQKAEAEGNAFLARQLEGHIRELESHRVKIDYGVLSYRVITDTGVAFLVDDWDVNTASGTNDITTLKYHGCGTGVGNEAAGDSALGTESTTALNPDSTRATGTQSQPAANQLRSVGTLTFDADAAITEHGLFSQAATGGGTLWDRSKFAAINVVGASGDSIQFTYTCTISSGG